MPQDILLALCFFSLVSAVVVAVWFQFNLNRVTKLAPIDGCREFPQTRITVITPARNEEADLERGLRSVLAQQGVQLEVLVINDHSDDRTGAIADAIAAEDHRVTVIHNPTLRPGWLGKCNAMEDARVRATGDIIVLTDADVVHDSRCFQNALAHLHEKKIDFLSLFPLITCKSFWENVTLPAGVINCALLFWTSPPKDPRSKRVAAAGALIMVKRDVLQAAGGFAPVKDKMLDDIELARHIHASGYPLDFGIAPKLLQVQMFKGNHHAFWGMTKNILAVFGSPWMVLPQIVFQYAIFWSPAISVVYGLSQRRWSLALLGMITIALHLFLFQRVRPWCQFIWRKAIFYPLIALPVTCCFAVAMYQHLAHGAVLWRGRSIRLEK